MLKTIITNIDKLKVKRMGDISKNFNRSEFSCGCGCGFSTVDTELLKVLELVRRHFIKPVDIGSGCRCDEHNKKIGGSQTSKHKQGIAADIVVRGIDPYKVYLFLDGYAPNKYGVGHYDNFTHIDIRKNKSRWRG